MTERKGEVRLEQKSRLLLIAGAFLAGLLLFFVGMLVLGPRLAPPASIGSVAIGGPFSLTDQDGKTVTDADLKGKPFLVFFGFTNCPDVCPTTLFDVSEMMRSLGKDADKTAALFISVDPERDTAAKLKDYLGSFDPRVRGLTGSAETIAAVEKSYRVYAKKIPTTGDDYTMDHTAIVYLMDKQGHFVAPFNLKRRPEDSAADLRRYF